MKFVKSTLYELYQEYIKSIGVSEEQIISINLENPDFDNIGEYKELYDYVSSKLLSDKMNYVFLMKFNK